VALFQLEGSSNEETEFERVRFSEKGCGADALSIYMSEEDFGILINFHQPENHL
jgi:hypothetical protein